MANTKTTVIVGRAWPRAALPCVAALTACLAGCGGTEGAAEERMEGGYARLPEPTGAMGSSLLGDTIYVFGGHTKSAHNFSTETQSQAFRRLRLAAGSAWEELAALEAFEGAGLAAHEGLLYRVGGLRVDNAPGEPEALHSVETVSRYDPAGAQWEDLVAMPEGRSAHGVALVGDTLYAVAGWALSGASGTGVFNTGGFKLDLSRADATWEAIPEPPFKLRSLAVAAVGEMIYAMGGATDVPGEFTSNVYRLDTKAGAWSEGPVLPGSSPIKAFGAAACSIDGRLYVNYAEGFYRLNAAGDGWEVAGTMKTPRVFNALICASADEVIAVGGFSLDIDPVPLDDVESIDVSGM